MFCRLLLALALLSLPVAAERPEVDKIVQTPVFEVRLGSALSSEAFTSRLFSIRRHLVGELGWIVPGTRFTPDPTLAPGEYQILRDGQPLGRARLEPGQVLAIGPESKLESLTGTLTHDPTYQMPGKWAPAAEKAGLEAKGLMVFEPTSVWATQMTELLRESASDWYTPDQLQAGLAVLQSEQPALVNRFHTDPAAFARLLAVIRNLLRERVCVRDLATLGEVALQSGKDPDSLSEAARRKLAGSILADVSTDRVLQIVEVGPKLEAALCKLGSYGPQGLVLSEDPLLQSEVLPDMKRAVGTMQDKGLMPVLVTSPASRLILRRLTAKEYPNSVILGRDELLPYYKAESVGTIEIK